jgi:hypothetical protein
MPLKRIIMVHGIGDNNGPAFSNSWKAEMIKAFPQMEAGIEFKSLYWEDMLREAATRFPLIEQNFATVLQDFGIGELKAILDSQNFKVVQSYIMDVLAYVGLPDMTLYFQNGCYQRLKDLSAGAERETLIIAHSLGAAMIPHVLWRMRQNTGSIPFHSLILLASPLGFSSPFNWAISDFLEVMGRISGTDRADTLRSFALAFTRNGDKRLHFISNVHDIVCADARYEVLGMTKDLIPVRQGFDDKEWALLAEAHEGCHHQVDFGAAELGAVGNNHDVVAYIQTQEFRDVLEGLLNA